MNTDKMIEFFKAGVNSVLPDKLINSVIRLNNDRLTISGLTFNLNEINSIFVVGAGKASAFMAKEVESILGDRITSGHIIVKYEHACPLKYIKVTEAGHPTPDKNSFAATKSLTELIDNADENDLVICLFSGGGSSLMCDYPETCTENDLAELNKHLVTCGANIHEMNAVRKHLSFVKGGWLAKRIYPARCVALLLSDVVGDSLDVIASGPTAPDSSTFETAYRVLEQYHLLDKIAENITGHIKKGVEGQLEETPKQGDMLFESVNNMVIGSNRIALEFVKKMVEDSGIHTEIISSTVQDDSCRIAAAIVEESLERLRNMRVGERLCLLYGGETTTLVRGTGLGGRNQHLALYASKLLRETKGITILSAGTDGNDGPTDAAGAIVDSEIWKYAVEQGINPDKYLDNYDSYHFFEKVGGLIRTGATGTNVMDIIIVLLEK